MTVTYAGFGTTKDFEDWLSENFTKGVRFLKTGEGEFDYDTFKGIIGLLLSFPASRYNSWAKKIFHSQLTEHNPLLLRSFDMYPGNGLERSWYVNLSHFKSDIRDVCLGIPRYQQDPEKACASGFGFFDLYYVANEPDRSYYYDPPVPDPLYKQYEFTNNYTIGTMKGYEQKIALLQDNAQKALAAINKLISFSDKHLPTFKKGYKKVAGLLSEDFEAVPGVNYHIFAGATKPFHAGHDQMIMKVLNAARQDPNGQALIFIGLGNRPPVRGQDMGEIWQQVIEPHYRSIDPSFYLEYGGGPVGKVLTVLGQANELAKQGYPVRNKFYIYSDPEDTQDYYLMAKYSKKDPNVELKSSPRRYSDALIAMDDPAAVFMGQKYPELFTRGGEQGTVDISGTAMRGYLSKRDLENFSHGLPDWMTGDIKAYVFGKLSGALNEARKRDNLILGQEDFTHYLEEIMDEIQYIKSSYGSRRKSGKQYRKEAGKLQDAYSTLRHLKRRNERLIAKEQNLTEDIGRDGIKSFLLGSVPEEESQVVEEEKEELTRDVIKNFIRSIK